LSSFADNITATLVAVALILSLQLDQAKNIKLAVLAVFGINSGGAALITGDVTTLMIFNAGKVGILDLLHLVPAGLISCTLLACLMLPGFKGDVRIPRQRKQAQLLDKVIGIIFLLTILLTLVVNSFMYIPPLLVFLFGLSLVFLLVHWVRHDPNDIPIMDYIRKIEFDTLLFFLGVLLLVGMLKEIGTLDVITQLYTVLPNTFANYAIGLCSAVLDNVPLTAAVLGSELNMPLEAWLGLTYSVGVGGSMLAIGSAAGIIVMSKVQGVTFGSYLRYFPHLLIAYSTGFALVNVM
ncbi:MAG: sodium:proton antiporter NhaD, partial [Moraxellaceae bacterium]|nr:sodium:proton antiporter NhaD [Moraxellaceae bacterium]